MSSDSIAAELEGRANALDEHDPLAPWRDEFIIADPELVYLDGNSLGMTPRRTAEAINRLITTEWAHGLITSWDHWMDLPERVGAELAPLIGAQPDEVVVHDSVSVNLYQLVHAARRLRPDRTVMVVSDDDFPSDRYIVAGIAQATGCTLVTDPHQVQWDQVAVAVRSLVDYRTAEIADLITETHAANEAGALMIWDVSHAAGVLEVDLGAHEVPMAVGCTYKFLNGGPGAPGFSYVSRSLIEQIDQPIRGWWSQEAMFDMDLDYQPRRDIGRLLIGTPGILGLAAAREGIALTTDAGINAIATKARALTGFGLDCCDALGLVSPTPRDPERRGGHFSVQHEAAKRINYELRTEHRVLADFRRPDLIRFGCSPLTTRYLDVARGCVAIAQVSASLSR
jgi:kynureninase